jgi:hypothetical protein
MSEAMKLKAISKAALREGIKKPSRMSWQKKGRGNGPKGLPKLVDKRLKSDTRGEKEKRKNRRGVVVNRQNIIFMDTL